MVFTKVQLAEAEVKVSNCKDEIRKQIEDMDRIFKESSEICHQIAGKEIEPEYTKKEVFELQKKLNKATRILEQCDFNLPTIKEYELMEATDNCMSIEKIDNIYHYILDDLLPHRITYEMNRKTLKHDYLRSQLFSSYTKVVEEYRENQGFDLFEKKILVYFIHYYKSTDSMTDHDNLDQKPFIDASINRILVRDDSPAWICYHADYKIGIYRHTEAFVGYPHDVYTYLHEKGLLSD